MDARTQPIRILATAFDYRPRMGGIATLGFELLKALSQFPDLQIRLLAPAEEGAARFDMETPIETLRVPIPRGITGASLTYAWHLSREIRTWNPDLIFHFLWIPEGIGSFWVGPLRKWKGIPYFVYAHGVELQESSLSFRRRLRKWLRPLKHAVLGGAESVLVNSHFTKNLVANRCRVKDEEIHVVHPGVDPTLFFPEPKAEDLVRDYGLQGKKVFLTLTRLDDYKGVDHGILAMKEVVKKHPEAVYLICGEGRDKARLESLVRETGLASNVLLVGAIPFSRVRDYYNLADVFMLLSREHIEPPDVEGFGIVFLEASACAIPVIGGRSGGIPDAVEEGVSGWLVPPTDDAAIARTMIEAIENPTEALDRGRRGRARVLSGFTWNHMAEKSRLLILAATSSNKIK